MTSHHHHHQQQHRHHHHHHTIPPFLRTDHIFKGVGKSIGVTLLDMWELNPISRSTSVSLLVFKPFRFSILKLISFIDLSLLCFSLSKIISC
jgi:hypothetical protein